MEEERLMERNELVHYCHHQGLDKDGDSRNGGESSWGKLDREKF